MAHRNVLMCFRVIDDRLVDYPPEKLLHLSYKFVKKNPAEAGMTI